MDVTPILGFTFLDRLNPKISWVDRVVKVNKNGHWRVLKTIARGSHVQKHSIGNTVDVHA